MGGSAVVECSRGLFFFSDAARPVGLHLFVQTLAGELQGGHASEIIGCRVEDCTGGLARFYAVELSRFEES